jgi:hypothetical protein
MCGFPKQYLDFQVIMLHIGTFSKRWCVDKFLKTKVVKRVVLVFNLAEELVFCCRQGA